MIEITNENIIHTLDVDKIKTLDDIKRVLEFLNIQAIITKDAIPNGYEKVKDLFE